MTIKHPADIKLRLTVKAGLKYILHKGEIAHSLGRPRITFVGGLQYPNGTWVKPAFFSLRLKTLHPLRRGITSDNLSPSVNELEPVMTLTGNGLHQCLADSYGGLKND